MSNIEDQCTDVSGAYLTQVVGSMKDAGLGELVLQTLFSMDRPQNSSATFPVTDAKNTLLSRVYFEAQRDKLPAEVVGELEAKIGVAEELFNVNVGRIVFLSEEKVACDAWELLPGCYVASNADLVAAGDDFSKDFTKLSSEDCVTFSRNFIKAAAVTGVQIPGMVSIFADYNVVPSESLSDSICMRKFAMDRCGNSEGSAAYEKLSQYISQCDIYDCATSELHKLAGLIDSLDKKYSLHLTKTGKTLPSSWECVFRSKTAEDSPEKKNISCYGMSKADIIGKYGEGILEEVEDPEGNIDYDRLTQIVDSSKEDV